VLVARERRIARGVVLRGARDDVMRRGRIARNMQVVIAGESGTGQPRLDAAMLAAEARRARPLVVGGPRQRVVPPLAANRIAAFEHAAIDDDPAADAGAEDDAEYDTGAASRAVGRLRQREAIRIVRECDGPSQ